MGLLTICAGASAGPTGRGAGWLGFGVVRRRCLFDHAEPTDFLAGSA